MLILGLGTAGLAVRAAPAAARRKAARLPAPAPDLCPPPRMGAMSDVLPSCPQCSGLYTYEMGALLVCPECAHEWSAEVESAEEPQDTAIKDSVGNVLADGDTVTVVKDLKVKGQAQAIKVGTKVRNIRLVDPIDGHDISCKVDGFGPMHLKSSVVKKV